MQRIAKSRGTNKSEQAIAGADGRPKRIPKPSRRATEVATAKHSKSKKGVSRMVQRAYMMVVRDWKSPRRECSMYLGKSNYIHKVIESDIEGYFREPSD